MAHQPPNRGHIQGFMNGSLDIGRYSAEGVLDLLNEPFEGKGIKATLCTPTLCSLLSVGKCPKGSGSFTGLCQAWLPNADSVSQLEDRIEREALRLAEVSSMVTTQNIKKP